MFERFNLRDNAFPVTPSAQESTPWFGFRLLKREFEAIFHRSSTEQLRLCVLNRGRLGAGKTHAAQYFAAEFARKEPFGTYHSCVSIVIEAPKQPAKAFVEFTGRLLNEVTFRRIAEASKNLRSLSNADTLFSKLLEATGSEDIATVLSRIDDANLLTSKAFLLGGGTAKEFRTLGVAKKLTSEHEFASAVVAVLYLLIHGQSGDRASVSRIALWMDEMEDLVYFPTRYYLPFTQALREIIDRTNRHLTLMLNFTFSEPEDLPAIENVLGQAIMQRVNHHVIFQQPTIDDMRDYLLELFKFNRVDNRGCSVTFPFSPEAFELLAECAVSKTPRFLNKLCDMLLRDFHDNPNLDLTNGREISRDIVQQRLPGVLNLLEEARG